MVEVHAGVIVVIISVPIHRTRRAIDALLCCAGENAELLFASTSTPSSPLSSLCKIGDGKGGFTGLKAVISVVLLSGEM
jgi:hypothetical protein